MTTKSPQEQAEEWSELEAVRTDWLKEAPTHLSLVQVDGVTAFKAGGLRGFLAGYNAAAPRWIPVEEALPEDGQWVLVHVPNQPWTGIPKEAFTKVVQFIRGRENPHDNFSREDRWGNNLVPYCWNEFGPGSFFGQEVSDWMPLPAAPKEEPK